MAFDQNYTVGRGEMFFDEFVRGTTKGSGERYVGNTPQFNITVESTRLDHYSSDQGIRLKDDSVTTQVNRTASLITDAIKRENLEIFFMGTSSIVTSVAAASQTETFAAVKQDRIYQLGVNATRPSGARKINAFTVTAPASAVEGVDYKVDLDRARIEIIKGSTVIADGATLTVGYSILAHNREVMAMGNVEKTGALRFVSHNAKGNDWDYFFPYAKLTPNGDFALKSDEWQQLPLMVEILQLPGYAPGYMGGLPYLP